VGVVVEAAAGREIPLLWVINGRAGGQRQVGMRFAQPEAKM
jgi:hypothetical protein